MDAPSSSFIDATGLPFVFDTQLLEGTVPVRVPSRAIRQAGSGCSRAIDRTGAGVVRRGQMPARNGVFGYNLSSQ